MGIENIYDMILGLFATALGWLWHKTDRRITDNEKGLDILGLKVEGLHSTYLKREDFKDHMDGVMRALIRIEDKLDGKADKP